MKRFAMALALMCALSISTFAGDMPTGGKTEPPPPATSSTLLVSVILTVLSLR